MLDTMRLDLTAALKSGDRVAVAALRSALSAVENAGAVRVASGPTAGGDRIAGAVAGLGAAEAPRRELDDVEVRAIVHGEMRERSDAALEFARLGRQDRADRLRAEATVLGGYL